MLYWWKIEDVIRSWRYDRPTKRCSEFEISSAVSSRRKKEIGRFFFPWKRDTEKPRSDAQPADQLHLAFRGRFLRPNQLSTTPVHHGSASLSRASSSTAITITSSPHGSPPSPPPPAATHLLSASQCGASGHRPDRRAQGRHHVHALRLLRQPLQPHPHLLPVSPASGSEPHPAVPASPLLSLRRWRRWRTRHLLLPAPYQRRRRRRR